MADTIADTLGFEGSVTGEARKFSCDVAGIGIALKAFRALWDSKGEKVSQEMEALKREIGDADKKILRLMDRIVKTETRYWLIDTKKTSMNWSRARLFKKRKYQNVVAACLTSTKLLEPLTNTSQTHLFSGAQEI
ncbi:hypothetical protein QSV34_02520 [Porticoccus sp. W117]|uniref:hypothetical protein n=1 Tax=Porticoccus sp. W117 TaxID=3054777 RepID=UPI00259A0C5A|nr:hypothetical protein [Porticoccus sp. W117]MDM3870225.1 hypothetical protein [Porticoccus sp. W117]